MAEGGGKSNRVLFGCLGCGCLAALVALAGLGTAGWRSAGWLKFQFSPESVRQLPAEGGPTVAARLPRPGEVALPDGETAVTVSARSVQQSGWVAGRTYQSLVLLSLSLQGGGADGALSLGRLAFDHVTTPDGEELERLQGLHDLGRAFVPVGSVEGLEVAPDAGALTLTLQFWPPATLPERLARVEGKLWLRHASPEGAVVVEEPASLPEGEAWQRVESPVDIEDTVVGVRRRDVRLEVRAEGPDLAGLGAFVSTKDGRRRALDVRRTHRIGGRTAVELVTRLETGEDRLVVTMRAEDRSVEFSATDVPVE